MNPILKEYLEEIDDIFKKSKALVDYDLFTCTVKEKTKISLAHCKRKAKQIVIEAYEEVSTESLLNLMVRIQAETGLLLVMFKQLDEEHKTNILNINPGLEHDSKLAVGFNFNNINGL